VPVLAALAAALPSVARAQECIGDIDGNGQVLINELIIGVNCALGTVTPNCGRFDANDNGAVTIDELVRGVNNALGSCEMPVPVMLEGVDAVMASARVAISTVDALQVMDLGYARVVPGGATAASPATQWRLSRRPWAAARRGAPPPANGIATDLCPRAGSADVQCVVNGGDSTRTIVYDRCEDDGPNGSAIVRDGMLIETVGTQDYCSTGEIPPTARVRLEMRDFVVITNSPGGAFLNRRRATLTDDFQPEEAGCDGIQQGSELIDGTIRFDCDLDDDPDCSPGIADITVRPANLRIVRTAHGPPCQVRLVLTGDLETDNAVTGDQFRQTFSASGSVDDRFTVTETALPDGTSLVRGDGRTTVQCLGEIEIRTEEQEAIRLDSGEPCPLAGALRVTLAPGAGSAPAAGGAASPQPAGGAAEVGNPGAVSVNVGVREYGFRAANGQVYQVLQNPAGNAGLGTEDVRITTLIGSTDAVARCDASAGAGSPAQAVVAAATEGMAFPLAGAFKSELIRDVSVPCFNPNGEDGNGTVCLGRCSADCRCPSGGCAVFSIDNATPLSAASAGIPGAAAPTLGEIGDACSGFSGLPAYAFGTDTPTTAAALCAAGPADGFTLTSSSGTTPGVTLIVAYAAPFAAPFHIGSAGFAIDANGSNPVRPCGGSNRVISGLSNRNELPPPLVRFAERQSVEFDFNGDKLTDKSLTQCLERAVVPCLERTPTPTPTPGINPACPGSDLQSDELRRDSTLTQGNLQGGASCGDGGNSSAERTYRYEAPSDGFYTIDTLDIDGLETPFDTLLYVRRDGSCVGAELACNDNAGAGVVQSRVGLTLERGEEIAIIVDGSGGERGDFLLRISRSEQSPTPTATLTPTPRPELPDLFVTRMSAPTTAEIGDFIDVSATVRNQGMSAAGEFEVAFVIATDAELRQGRIEFGSRCTVSALDPSTSDACPLRVRVPPGLSDGTYFIGAVADPAGEVEETDELNNTRVSDSGAIELRGAPTATPEDTATPTITLTASVTATETLTATTTPTPAASATASPTRTATFTASTTATVTRTFTRTATPTKTGSPTAVGTLRPVAGEFQISMGTGNQINSAVCRNPEGNFVVTWEGPEENRTIIRARSYASDGTPAGDEFMVSSSTTSDQRNADVSCAASGQFTVVWEEFNARMGIFARRFSPSGTPLEDEMQVDTSDTRFPSEPAIAMDSMGRFVIAWATLEGIFVRRFDAGGNPLGDDFRVDTDTAAAAVNPACALLPDRSTAFTWTGDDDIYIRRFDRDGEPQGTEFLATVFTPPEQVQPSISSDADGNFVVVWTSYDQTGQGSNVIGRRFTSIGQPLGIDFIVNVNAPLEQNFPQVSVQPFGAFVVVWSSGSPTTGQDGSQYGIFGRRFSSGGQPIGGEFQVNAYTVGTQRNSAISVAGDGEFIVTWQSDLGGMLYQVFGRRFR
jgi:hypothetical protein